jgi:hypothetical protein
MGLPGVCVCGWAIPGNDEEERCAALRAHTNEAHPDYQLQDHQLRDFLGAIERMEPPPPRLDEVGAIEVHQVTPDRLPDFLESAGHHDPHDW